MTYEYHYLKIPDLIANVGGLMNLVQPIFEKFFNSYLKNSFFVYLYHQKIFKLELEDEETKENIKNNVLDPENESLRRQKLELENRNNDIDKTNINKSTRK